MPTLAGQLAMKLVGFSGGRRDVRISASGVELKSAAEFALSLIWLLIQNNQGRCLPRRDIGICAGRLPSTHGMRDSGRRPADPMQGPGSAGSA